MKKTYRFSSIINAPRNEVFAWHERNGALERLSPPWDPLVIIDKGGIEPGSVTTMIMREGPVKYKWSALHTEYEKNVMFRDTQLSGPLKSWSHTHLFEDTPEGKCLLTDIIELEAPFSAVGKVLLGTKIKKKLSRIFKYRHETTQNDMLKHVEFKKKHGTWKILISGASGLIGSSLASFLSTGGHEVFRLVRSKPESHDEIFWDPSESILNPEEIEGFDAIIHLAGENIGESRWSAKKKKLFLESRTNGTRLIAESVNSLNKPPKVIISASATGFYGDRGDEIITEKHGKGDLFISDLCDAWEKSASEYLKKNTRLATARIGVVLTPEGGALARMLPVFSSGFGGMTGSGRQYMSWISMDDVIASFYHIMANEDITGKVNIVSPHPVTNEEFTKTLSRILRRPAFANIPETVLKKAFGQMADEILLSSARVIPDKLLKSGYAFLKHDLESALRHTLGR